MFLFPPCSGRYKGGQKTLLSNLTKEEGVSFELSLEPNARSVSRKAMWP